VENEGNDYPLADSSRMVISMSNDFDENLKAMIKGEIKSGLEGIPRWRLEGGSRK
jgi:hypothetical protein